jgi:MFS family permease
MTRSMSLPTITFVVSFSLILGLTSLATFPALLPLFIDEWQLSKIDAGWINGLYFVGYLSVVPILSSLTDRVPPRIIFLTGMAVSCVSSAAFALYADGFWTATIFRTLTGAGLAGIYMPGLKMLTDHLSGPTQSRYIAFYTASFGVGAALSYLLAGELNAVLNWQWAFGAAAIGPAIGAFLIVAFLPLEAPHREKAPDTHLLDFRPVFKCRPAMGYVLAYMAHNFELFAFRSWIVAFLFFVQGTQAESSIAMTATQLAAIINLAGLPASVLGNELAVKIGRQRAITLLMILSSLVALSLGFVATLPFWVLFVFCIIYSMTILGDSAAVTAGVIGAAPEGYKGATMAVHTCIGFTGSFLGPLAFGVALDMTSGGVSILSWGIAFGAIGLTSAVVGPLALVWARR